MGFELRIANPPFTGSSYRPRTHIVEESNDLAICNFEPKEGWDKITGKKIEDVECKNCQRTYIRYIESLFELDSKKHVGVRTTGSTLNRTLQNSQRSET